MNAKLTAYALNELPPDERAALEAEMETNPALRVEAEEMRKFCALLHDEVADAEKETLTTEQRVRVLREFSADTQPQLQPQAKKAERSIWRHPAFLVPTAIAACTTVMLVINLNDRQSAPVVAKEVELLVEKRLAERSKSTATAEDVRVKFEKAGRPVVAAGQTPAPGKPEMPALVAANAPTVRDAETNALLPLPTAGAPAAPTLLMPQSLDGTSLAIQQTTESAGTPGALSSDFSGANSLGRTPSTPEIASRGIDIGTARPLQRYQLTPEAFSITPGTPAVAEADAFNAWSTPAPGRALGYRDLNEPVVNLTPSGAPMAQPPADAATVSPSHSIGVFGGGILAERVSSDDDALGGTVSLSGSVAPLPPPGEMPIAGRLFQTEGTTGMSKVGAGSLTLSGPSSGGVPIAGEPVNTYSGGTTINSGGLVAANGAPATPAPDETAATTSGAAIAVATSSVVAPAAEAEHFKRAEMHDQVASGWRMDAAAPAPTTAPTGTIAGSGGVQLQMNGGTLVNNTAPSSSPAAAAAQPAKPFSRADLGGAAPAPPAATGPQALGDTSAPAAGVPAASSATATKRATGGYQLDLAREDDPILAANTTGVSTRAAGAAAPYSPPIPAKDGAYNNAPAPTDPEMERLQDLQQTTQERIKDLRDKARELEARTRQMAIHNPGGETYTPIYENPFLQVTQQPLSTFSIDVDTASYANVRRFLNKGQRPPADAVRLEELINYFPYTYEPPAEDGAPFSVTVDMAEAPWQPMHRLARIALKGRDVRKDRGAANFVFLVDVSGSMDQPDKLPLVKQSLRMLTEQLKDTDRVAIVTYAGESGVKLSSTPGSERKKIINAIDNLDAGGSTNGAGGIRMAYQQAAENFEPEGVNRVILCTDGDFNVGISSPEELEKLIAEKAKSRVFLSVLGYGTGNLKDRTMETLADKGNGNYAYIDSLSEARKVLVDQMNATLVTIAKDVKIQVEFNPGQVAAYRLLGYENRALAKEDFNNDRKDAGEIGAGHTVTALYEIVPVGAGMTTPDGRPMVDELKYAPKPALLKETPSAAPVIPGGSPSKETMTVKLRYKQPTGDKSQLLEVPVTDKGQTMGDAPQDFVFAAGVTGFGMMLRNSQYSGELTWDMVRALSLRGKGEDPMGYRGEFLQLIDKARGLMEGRE